jgi:hypothetical protein
LFTKHLDVTCRIVNTIISSTTWFDLVGFIGVVLIIGAYLLLQLEKLASSSPAYSLLNAVGALLIIVSLVFRFNLSAFIVEAFWVLISLLGLWRSLGNKNLKAPGNRDNECQAEDAAQQRSGQSPV